MAGPTQGADVVSGVPTLGDVVEVADTETVVRLDGRPGRLAELVLTGDVVGSLAAVLDASGDASGDRATAGAAFFVVGPFGSGKSHFLAALAELFADPHTAIASGLASWDEDLRRRAALVAPSLAVAVPLVEYRAQARLEDVVSERAWRALGMTSPAPADNRAAAWEALFDAARRAGHAGLVLLLDELSEFLRAKQGPELTEDLRFLQFIGEWTRQHPVTVVGALQESIDEVANVSQRELGRIRDRYRPSLTLSMRHVEDLVHRRLIRLRPGGEHWVRAAHDALCTAFPSNPVGYETFARCYPLHPETLRLLEGLRFLLSQQRGIVDFVCRSVRAALGRPCLELITPDLVYDHFVARLHERQETSRLAGTVVPYYERVLDELFEVEDRALALRTVKLLVLLAASPLERPRTAAELADMLQARMSDVDPSLNASYLEAAVLRAAVERGAYVVTHHGPPRTYEADAGADAALVFAARVAETRAELHRSDRRLVATLAELGSTPTLPLDTLGQLRPSRRELLWQNTLRSLVVDTVRLSELSPDDAETMVSHALAAGAEGCLVVAEPELTAVDAAEAAVAAETAATSTRRLAIWVPACPTETEHDTMLDLHARRHVLDEARRAGLTDLVSAGEQMCEADTAVARELLRRLYFDGAIVYPPSSDGERPRSPDLDLPSLAGLAFERQLPRLADPLLSRLHPLHAEVAPRGELVGERLLHRLVHEIIPLGRIPPAAMTQLRQLVDGYLVPLGLARSRRDGATIAPDPARSPAVAELLRLVGDRDMILAADVVAELAAGPLGLSTPESILVLNACASAGLVEIVRGRKRLADPFLAVTPSDRIAAGELVEQAVRDVAAQLGPVVGPGPLDPWTAATQRAAWQYAQAWLEARREELAQVDEGLRAVEEIPALGGTETAFVLADAAEVRAVVEAASGAPSAAAGLRALAAAADTPESLLAASRRLSRLARFFRDDLRRVDEAAAYLTHPDLQLPDGDVALRTLHASACELLGDVLQLVAEDRVAELFTAVRELRSAYLGVYQDAHERHYASAAPAHVRAVRATPAYRALVALSSIGAVAVPNDQVKVDRALAAAVPTPCTRRLDQELLWRPVCSCGFRLGDPAPVVDQEGLVALAARGVAEHLAELSVPERRDRLEAAAADLESIGRAELASALRQLISLAARWGDGASGNDRAFDAIVGLLEDELQRTIRDVLAGSHIVVTRDLAALREDLIGRRYPKRRLLELFEAWVDPDGDVPAGSFVEVRDSAEDAIEPLGQRSGSSALDARGTSTLRTRAPGPADPARQATRGVPSSTVALVAERWPSVAALLPSTHGADALWLAAWWAGRPAPPPWLPAALFADPERVREAARAALADPGARAELAELDRRAGEGTVLGSQIAAALDLAHASARDALDLLRTETLLRHPLRLATDALLRRVAGDWQLVTRLGRLDVEAVAAAHALVEHEELAALSYVLDAAEHLAEVERRLPTSSAVELVEDVYAAHGASVPWLVSRAELAASSGSLADPAALAQVRNAAVRLLAQADEALDREAAKGFPGCLMLWDVGRHVVEPLLRAYGRVAVLLVDALRADLGVELAARLAGVLSGRTITRRWAVVPAPTRTAEALGALASGMPVPAGSARSALPARTARTADPLPLSDIAHQPTGCTPFAHLGYETAVLSGADRDYHAAALRELWSGGPPLSIAVATAVDERLHRTSAELAALLADAMSGLERRVLPSLAALPDQVPFVVLADHGFRENPSWGRGPEGRYVHGGTSLEECVVPVIVAEPHQPA